MNNFYLKIVLVFCGMMLLVSLYFILFSVSIGSDYRLYITIGDFVNMASFAFVATALIVSFFWLKEGRRNRPLLLALGMLVFIMALAVSINRYLAVYPASGAEALFFYVGILDFLTAIVLPIGVWKLVDSLMIFVQKHD